VSPRQRFVRLSVSAVAVIAGGSAVFPSAAPADAVSNAVAARINAYRASHGLPRLVVDGRLSHAARSQSSAMMSRRTLAHGPTGSGKERLTRLCMRMKASTVGETIGWIRFRRPSAQAAGIVRWWMNSPPHRAALMSSSFKRIGVGRRIGRAAGHKVVWFTADMSG
jgi:uncharacterized protein YkwD